MSATIHLHPTASLAPRVLLPGDPGRALRLAQALLSAPKMFNHNRGLWGYTGTAPDGRPMTVQSTGMGGPSAAIVASELVDLGAEQLVRVGTCGALDADLALGELVVVTAALARDGTSRALGAGERALPDFGLTHVLCESAQADHRGAVVSTDLFYDASSPEQGWREAGAMAVEMEAATLFTLAGARGVQAAALLVVSDLLLPARRRIAPDALTRAEERLGRVALDGLAASGQDASRQQTQAT